MDGVYYALGVIVVVGLIRPVFWLIALSTSLWIGRKFLSEKWGRIVFGDYWRSPSQN